LHGRLDEGGNPVRVELKTAGYAPVNLRTSYEWEHIRVDFGVENIFDQYYEHPLGGTNIGYFLLPAEPFGAVPSMGRNIYAGITMKF
jgi:iron complex outermembrane receptor protein